MSCYQSPYYFKSARPIDYIEGLRLNQETSSTFLDLTVPEECVATRRPGILMYNAKQHECFLLTQTAVNNGDGGSSL